MRSYEAMFILRPSLDEEAVKANVEKFKGIIENNGGEIENVDLWGKRRLAYPISKVNEGYYVLVNFKGNSELPKELTRNFKISDDVIRDMVVKIEN
ncbi:small subunit ribosomal protein S6 [Clostridium collagenovorans DSM 3089]|uniref:Small ribosomal subunit protein bS6 n=1 Tax=Clostridium collagenovorans DSM 3089 TaxID=1121306 RepID=A0A1M5YG02_9CLOT|nr:30S ribosomal protein S6 [Clostridium collagenovorans]SHI10977.1 small subunit ribosomal protein S6 [Clostridium collagenovorans DSM 3089]